MSRLAVDIWSDIACPWCYVGKRRFEAALSRFEHRGQVDITWRAFELDPSAPRRRDPAQSYAQRLAGKYHSTEAQAEAMIRRMVDTAAADQLDLRFDRVQSGNTFDAHRLIHLAAEHDRQGEAKERVLLAYFTEGRAIGDRAVLAELGAEIGLDPVEVEQVLAGDRYAREVRADEAEAQALGIHGVPFFVIGQHGVSGAQPADLLLRVLDQAWAEQPVAVQAGEACTPDGCPPA